MTECQSIAVVYVTEPHFRWCWELLVNRSAPFLLPERSVAFHFRVFAFTIRNYHCLTDLRPRQSPEPVSPGLSIMDIRDRCHSASTRSSHVGAPSCHLLLISAEFRHGRPILRLPRRHLYASSLLLASHHPSTLLAHRRRPRFGFFDEEPRFDFDFAFSGLP